MLSAAVCCCSESDFANSIRDACARGEHLLSVANSTVHESELFAESGHAVHSNVNRSATRSCDRASAAASISPIAVRKRWARYMTPKQSAQVQRSVAAHTVQSKRAATVETAVRGKDLYRTKALQLQTAKESRNKQTRAKYGRNYSPKQ